MCRAEGPAGADARLVLARALLVEATEVLGSLDVAELTEGSLGESVLDLLRARRRLEGSAAALADRFAHSSEWAADGARDATAWLRGRTTEGFGALRGLEETGARSRSFEQVGEALRRGEVSARHVQVLGEAARRFPRLLPHLRAAQPQIVALAQEREPHAFRIALMSLCLKLDPGTDRKNEKEFYLRASTLLDGQVRVDGMLPADVGALLIAALESARRMKDVDGGIEADPASHRGTDVDILGTPVVDAPLDVRTTGRRNVEALQRILTLAAVDSALPSVAGARPQVNVTVSVEALMGADHAWLERFGVPRQPISTETARRLACDATLRPLIVDGRGGLVAFGTATRTIAPAMRSLVVRRDLYCRFSGCRARIDEVHHVVFYSRGGVTRSDNLIGLCWHHHHLVHDGRWSIEGDANRDVKITGPDGRLWTSSPPGG